MNEKLMWPHLPLLQIFTQVRSYTYVLQYYGHVGCVDIKFMIYIESRKICRTFDICSTFDGIESACLQFRNFKAKPFAYVGCIAAYR